MPRSSRGSTSHRGHRTRGKHTETTLQATKAAEPQKVTTQLSGDDRVRDEQSAAPLTPSNSIKKSTAQPAAMATSGTTMHANPLLTKELIRIAVLATVELALVTTFTTLLQ